MGGDKYMMGGEAGGPGAAAAAGAAGPGAAPAPRGRVLVVEDHRETRELLRSFLEVEGYEVREARDGAHGLEQADRLEPDIILCDVMMPNLDGEEFVRRLRLAREGVREAPVLILTANLDEGLRARLLEAGAEDYLSKPFRLEDVRARVGNLVALRQARAQLKAAEISRRRAEAEAAAAQQMSAARLQAILDGAPALIFVKDPGGRYLLSNRALDELYGAARGEVLGQTDYDFVPRELADSYRENDLHVLETGEVIEVEETGLLPDGPHTFLSIKFPLLDSAGRVSAVCCFSTDITERKRESEALAASEARFSSFMQYLPAVAQIKDAEGRTLFVNDAFAHLFGSGRGHWVGRGDREMWPPEVADRFEESDRRVLQTGEMTQSIEVMTDAQGRTRYFLATKFPIPDSTGRPLLLGAVSIDVTERRKMEEALRRSEEYFRALIENASDLITVLSAEGAIRHQTPAVYRVLGYEEGELVGQSFFDHVHPEDEPALRRLYDELLETHSEARTAVFRLRHKSGHWRHFEATVTNLLGNPAVGGVVANARDVTERREAEAALRDAEAQLRQAQKMEAVGRLAGGIAHDFNNVLTSITGYTSLVLRRLDPESRAHHEIEEVKKAADRAAALTNQLLAFSRQQILQPRVLNLNTVVREAEAMLRRLIGEDIDLRTSLREELGLVRADPGQLTQVILNLAINSRDAMPSGGKLTIVTENAVLSESYAQAHQEVSPGGYVMLAVSDTGTGIPREVRDRIFDPFFTTKEQGKGTGLGLSTVYGIVRQSDGHIWLYSEEGRGTTFKIYLPVVEGVELPPGPAAAEAETFVQGAETVLLVEDEEVLRTMLKEVLEMCGYTVLAAADGEEAAAASREYGGPIHLLLTDVVMPGMSGPDLAALVAAERPEAKLLYMSGYTNEAVVHHGVLDEGINFLPKPFSPEGLSVKVRQVLDAGEGPPPLC